MGLGFGFMLEGLRTMSSQPWGGAVTLAIALVLLSRPAIPTMLVLLAGGVAASLVTGSAPTLAALATPAFTLPTFAWPTLSWHALEIGVLLLALPQLPLTFGNALFGVDHGTILSLRRCLAPIIAHPRRFSIHRAVIPLSRSSTLLSIADGAGKRVS
jgi:hypothetical protein